MENKKEQFKQEIRDAVLNSLDAVLQGYGERHAGWQDQDLLDLFKAVDAHAGKLWARHFAD